VTLAFITTPPSTVTAGDTISVTASLRYAGRTEGVPDVQYTITVTDEYDNVVGVPITGLTDADGDIIEELVAPDDPGDYELTVEVDFGVILWRDHRFTVEPPEEAGIPWLFILILLIIAVVAVILVGVGLARYGLGRLVECGECGAFIPEGEKKCPKCGAVFETETAKCSECGAWIPVDSKSCPECAAVFAGIEKEKKDYIERMKLQYAEYVDQYRTEAKGDLGEDMTDEEFMDWWKANPKYIGFEEWLKREEELRKGKTYTCPSCATVNPESATICFKCGTVFKKEEEEEILEIGERPGTPPAAVPAKVVPKPVAAPPTVVPKKVAKPPEGGAAPTVVPKKVVQAPPTVVPKKVVKAPPTVVPKKVVKKPPEEE
jgi:ribosomal protein L40E